MAAAPSILVIDDEQGILETLRILLKNEGFDVTTAQGGKAGLEQLKSSAPDIVLTDLKMPGVTGIEILSAVRGQDPETPVILMTAQASLQTAIQAVNEGAFYYIQKPFSNDDMVAICRRAAEHRRLRAENKQLKQEIRRRERSGQVKPLGKSKLFSDVLRLAEQVAPTESTVLIQGESGTGKEVIARYLHELSTRAEGQFLSLNCGALPESLLESELFGHVKGSFTGAVRDKQGLFAAARGGTFFLDEIGEMSPATQVKLLRVLQEREAIPVGGTEAIPVDVRVVAATNRDLEDDIKRGRFRTDLYYRLNVINIHLPPLRDRRDDITIFVKEFLSHIATERGEGPKILSAEAEEVIMSYDWPGNVRELENALERAVTLTKGDTIPRSAIPDKVSERKAEPLVAERLHKNPALDVIEQAYITWVLQSEGGNKTRAAEVLGIDPSTLYRKLSRYEGGVPDKKPESEPSGTP
jgi:DNA-binding NtrC family response regulator